MKTYILIFALATGCSSSKEDSGILDDTGTTQSTVDTSGGTETGITGETGDSTPPPVILENGAWLVDAPNIGSDTCGVNNYQDVTEFVPLEMMISNSSESSFRLDSETTCERNELDFTCSEQDVSESALAGTAELNIKSVMSGTIINNSEMDLTMNVVIESCEGIGCIAIEAALTFPCPVELVTQASRP